MSAKQKRLEILENEEGYTLNVSQDVSDGMFQDVKTYSFSESDIDKAIERIILTLKPKG